MSHLSNFGKEFSLHIQNSQFKPLFNTCYKTQLQKNSMNRFREKLKTIDLRPKKRIISLILDIINIFLKILKQQL